MRENVQTFREVLITGVQLQRGKDTQGSKNPVNCKLVRSQPRWLSDLIYVNTEAKTQRAPEKWQLVNSRVMSERRLTAGKARNLELHHTSACEVII